MIGLSDADKNYLDTAAPVCVISYLKLLLRLGKYDELSKWLDHLYYKHV